MASQEPGVLLESGVLPSNSKNHLHIPMRDLWARCNALNAEALFVLARILCGEMEVQENLLIQTDLKSAYYLAQTAHLLAQSQTTKKEIDAFINRQHLRAQNLEGVCKIFPSLGLVNGCIHGALSARALYDKIRAERPTLENKGQKRGGDGGSPQPSEGSEGNLPQEGEMNVFEPEGSSNARDLQWLDNDGKGNLPQEGEMNVFEPEGSSNARDLQWLDNDGKGNLPQEGEMNVFEPEGSSNARDLQWLDNDGKGNLPQEGEMNIFDPEDLSNEQRLSGRNLQMPNSTEPKNKSVFTEAIQFVKDHPAPFIILGVGLFIGVALATPVVSPAVLAGLLTIGIGIKMGAVIGGIAIADHAIGSAMVGVGILAIVTCCSIRFFGRKTSEEKKIEIPLQQVYNGT